jgi:hypothetical protein
MPHCGGTGGFSGGVQPLPLATLEEAAFRGVLLEQLLRSFPPSHAYRVVAIALSSAAFSSVHFIKRPYPGKPVWQPAYGLFIIGCLFGLAYVIGGRSLWLPIVIHAAAIFVIEVMRLYAVYQAPPWLLGYSEWPQSGLVGSILGFALVVSDRGTKVAPTGGALSRPSKCPSRTSCLRS